MRLAREQLTFLWHNLIQPNLAMYVNVTVQKQTDLTPNDVSNLTD